MSVLDYFRASHQEKLKQERIKMRVTVLKSLVVFQEAREAASGGKMRKLNSGEKRFSDEERHLFEFIRDVDAASLGRKNVGGGEMNVRRNDDGNAASTGISEIERRKGDKNIRSEEKDVGKDIIIEAFRNNNETNVERNHFYLNGHLAYNMLTASELWREILMFV